MKTNKVNLDFCVAFLRSEGAVETAGSGKHQQELRRFVYCDRLVIIRDIPGSELIEIFTSDERLREDLTKAWVDLNNQLREQDDKDTRPDSSRDGETKSREDSPVG